MTATVLFGLMLGLVTFGPTQASAQDLYNCGDFASQGDAQQAYDYNTNDPNGLDGPVGPTSSGEPGVACESGTGGTLTFNDYLVAIGAAPAAPAATQPPATTGGTDTGSTTGSGTTTLPSTGTGNSQSSSMTTMTLLLALVAAGCLALGGYGLLRGRRG